MALAREHEFASGRMRSGQWYVDKLVEVLRSSSVLVV